LGALETIEKEAGLKGKILRPLSSKLLPETIVEKRRLVDRQKLSDIRGRSRKRQFELAKKYNVVDYPCPAGGCLLTYREFANKLRDLFRHKKRVSLKDVALLKAGRHFRFAENKIIVGRDEAENRTLLQLKAPSDYCFEVPDCGSPTTILQGPKTQKAIDKTAALTAYYSDNKARIVLVKFGINDLIRSVTVSALTRGEVERLRVTR
jgi:predicted ribosome quality control (RQC) complex YloA/Tae2 family protein